MILSNHLDHSSVSFRQQIWKHRFLPGLLRATNEWFRIYKIPDGKPENNFAFNGIAKNRSYTMQVIEECHEVRIQTLTFTLIITLLYPLTLYNSFLYIHYKAWKRLITGKVPSKADKYDIKVYLFFQP